MANFLAELKRRHVYRVAAAYAVVAWVVIQLVNNITPMLNLPNAVGTAVLVFLAAGFPIVLIFAWVRELAPADGSSRATTGKLDYVLIGALVVVIGIFAYQQLAPTTGAKTAQETSVDAARAAANSPATAISIAVLPFVNLSSDKEQEFFSDGMTEEISGALAKIPDLSVVARTSAFQFKGQNPDIASISKALNATHLIEGTVRKGGDRVRITVQLVRASNGLQMWSENYDRNLTDIFAVQEEIARAVVTSLGMQLGLAQGARLISNRTSDSESYDQYLRAKALVRARGLKPVAEAAALLEQVVARDPNYAPAWALLAQAYSLTPQYYFGARAASTEETRAVVNASVSRAETAAKRANQLDPNLADGYIALSSEQFFRGNILAQEDLLKQALALDPNNPDALQFYSNNLAAVGHVKEALAIMQKLLSLEPFVPIFVRNMARVRFASGQEEAALAVIKALPPDEGVRQLYLAQFYVALGRGGEAADALREIPPGTYPQGIVEDAVRLLRMPPGSRPPQQTLPRLANLSFVYLYVNAPERVLDYFEEIGLAGGLGGAASPIYFWHPSYKSVRKTERFKAYVRKVGMVNYWRARGWPDLCRPMGADDFACD